MDATVPSNITAASRLSHDASPTGALDPTSSSASPARWFLILAGIHLLIWTSVAGLTQPNAPLDVVEMVYWGNEWQWGYHKHPPLPAWVAAAVTASFGGSILPLYLVSQLFIISTFWVCWRMARAVLEPWKALAAVAVLEFCLFYNYVSPEFNNNIPPKLFWALTVALLYFAMTGDAQTDRDGRKSLDWRNLFLWAGTGASIALSLLSKYDAAILVFSLLAFAVVHPRGRKAWTTAGPWLATLVAFAIFLPHLIWVWQNDFVTLKYFSDRSESPSSWLQHLTNPLQYVGAQLLSLTGVLVAIAILFRWRFTWRELGETQGFTRQYLAFAVLGPPLIVVALSLISGGKMKSSWGASMWTFLPLLMMLSFQFDAKPMAFRRLVRGAIAATCLLGVGLAVRNTTGPYLRSKPSRIHFPGSELAATVQRVWSEHNHEPLSTVGGDAWYAGNVAVYSRGDVSTYTDLIPEHAPWIGDDQLKRFGGVILWPIGDDQDAADMPELWKRRFPDARPSTPLVLPWQTAARLEPLRVGIAIVDPAANERFAKGAGSATTLTSDDDRLWQR